MKAFRDLGGSLQRAFALCIALAALAVGLIVTAPALAGSDGASAVAAAAGSDSCPPHRVDIFDLGLPPNPVPSGAIAAGSPEATAYLQWLDLTTASGGVSQALLNEDPTRGQVEYLDQSIAEASNDNGTVSNYNPGFDTAPAGPIADIDYLVTGQITGSQGAYTVTVSLQDATTRAQIASGSATFADSSDSLNAAEQAAWQLTPVLEKIRDYQTKLRQQSSDMAIAPPLDQPAISPARCTLKTAESTSVSIALNDCDGLALANRTLTLKATHGRFSPSTVKTDSSGHAHATFTATSHGIAQLTADYGPYETVNHKRDQRRGRAAIAIQSSGVWEVHIGPAIRRTTQAAQTARRSTGVPRRHLARSN